MSTETDKIDASAGEVGVPVDAVCTGCLSETGKRRVHIKRASMDDFGEVERRGPAGSAKLRGVKHLLRNGLDAWTAAGRNAEKFKAATVQWREEGRGRRQLPISHSALLG